MADYQDMTERDFDDDVSFAFHMELARKAYQTGVISVKEYWRFTDLMREEYHPTNLAVVMYKDPYCISDPDQWEKYHDIVPIRDKSALGLP